MKPPIGVIAICVFLLSISATRIQQPATPSPISPNDLRTWLQAFAHDSMEGRATGTRGHLRATQYLIAELTRLKVAPAGGAASYVQSVPLRKVQIDLSTAVFRMSNAQTGAGVDARGIGAGAVAHAPGISFIPLTGVFGLDLPRTARISSGVGVVFAGSLGSLGSSSSRGGEGEAVVVLPPKRPNGQPDYQLWSVREQLAKYRSAGFVILGTMDLMPRSMLAKLGAPQFELTERHAVFPRTAPVIVVPQSTVHVIQTDNVVNSATLEFTSRDIPLEAPPRNIIARIEGSDRELRNENVILSAHADHLGMELAADRGADSVYNGANAGGSGSVALLAIAERIAAMPVKPRRSIVFLWTVGAEQGLLGAEYFADKPTVPRASIVANIDVDMLVRSDGSTLDIHGAHRLSSEFAKWVAAASAQSGLDARPFVHTDSTQHMNFCTSGDWHFYRWGIPSISISSGSRVHQGEVGDDATGIDYVQFARRADFIAALVVDFANRPARPSVDAERPDSRIACVR